MKLFSSQQTFVVQLLALLQQASDKLIVLVSGFSGVGKTAVLEEAKPELLDLGASVVDGEDFAKLRCSPDRSYVVPVAPWARERIREQYTERFPKHCLVDLTLQGLDKNEMADYLAGLGYSGEILDLAVEVSMGIPLVGKNIAEIGLLDRPTAVAVSGDYVGRTLYLTPKTDDEVLEALKRYVRYTIPLSDVARLKKDRIHSPSTILAHAAMLMVRHSGEVLEYEPPIFIAPESEAIYDGLLNPANPSDFKRDCVMIFVPNISRELTERMLYETGMYNWHEPRYSRLWHMFAEIRKGGGYILDSKESLFGPWHGDNNFGERLRFSRASAMLADDDYPALGIYTRDHPECAQTVLIGAIGLETLLQQLGVPYLVNYGYTDAVYRYDLPGTMTAIE